MSPFNRVNLKIRKSKLKKKNLTEFRQKDFKNINVSLKTASPNKKIKPVKNKLLTL